MNTKEIVGIAIFSIIMLCGTAKAAPTLLSILYGGTGASTAQGAINNLSNVAAANPGQVLTKESGTGNAVYADIVPSECTAAHCDILDTNILNLSNSTTTMASGLYPAGYLNTIDTDLQTNNIKSGVNIYGINGKSSVIETSTGDASSTDIANGKIAFVNGSQVTGNVTAGANVAGGNAALVFTIPNGIYIGSKTCTASDTNLTAAKIKKGVSLFGVTGTYATFLPDTGQTTSFTATVGEDHNYTSANSSVCDRATPGNDSSFTDNTNGTITDNCTGLMWKKCPEGDDTTNCSGSASTYTWEQALAQCEGKTYASQTDWRLPNFNELMTINNYDRNSPAINTTYFPNTPYTYKFWTGTTMQRVTSYAFAVSMQDGQGLYDPKTGTNYVRCVRQ